jgi:hypothetical protein
MYFLGGEEICVPFSVLYGMTAYCVGTTLLLSLMGVKVVRGRSQRRARASSEKQAATVPTVPALEAGPLVDIVPEAQALELLEIEQMPLGNPESEIPFALVMSNILRNQTNNPFY